MLIVIFNPRITNTSLFWFLLNRYIYIYAVNVLKIIRYGRPEDKAYVKT